jgi:hypothetical protein
MSANSDAQVKTPDVQKSELVNQSLALFLGSLHPLMGHGHLSL